MLDARSCRQDSTDSIGSLPELAIFCRLGGAIRTCFTVSPTEQAGELKRRYAAVLSIHRTSIPAFQISSVHTVYNAIQHSTASGWSACVMKLWQKDGEKLDSPADQPTRFDTQTPKMTLLDAVPLGRRYRRQRLQFEREESVTLCMKFQVAVLTSS